MNIYFFPIDFTNIHDCAVLANWFNDSSINYLISPNFNQGPLTYITPEFIQRSNLYSRYEKHAYFISADNYIIGDVNIIDNPDFLLKTNEQSCWLGITIGEKMYRGLGIGKKAMHFIEKTAKDMGFKRIELGVFEYNENAITFYKKLGYKQIGRVKRFTFYNGNWYDDLRFEKYL